MKFCKRGFHPQINSLRKLSVDERPYLFHTFIVFFICFHFILLVICRPYERGRSLRLRRVKASLYRVHACLFEPEHRVSSALLRREIHTVQGNQIAGPKGTKTKSPSLTTLTIDVVLKAFYFYSVQCKARTQFHRTAKHKHLLSMKC